MDKVTQLLLITKNYPYATGEEFIENEIGFLAEAFDSVVILAVAAKKGALATREVPENVRVFSGDSAAQSIFANVMKSGSGARALKPLQCDYDTAALQGSLRKRLYFRYFAQKVQSIKRAIEGLLQTGVLNQEAPLVMYSYWFHDTAIAAVLCAESMKHAAPVVARAHRYDVFEEASPVHYHPLRPWLLDNINTVFSVSAVGAQYLDRKFPGFTQRIKTAYLGTEDHGLAPFDFCGEGWPYFHVVSCANLIPLKHIERVVAALALLEAETDLPIRWTHFGGGEQSGMIEAQAARLLKRTHWVLKGQVRNATLLDFYCTHPVHVLVSMSESEGIPVSMMEALSFGIPVVATLVGGTGELVQDGVSGIALPPNAKADMLAQVLRTLLDKNAEKDGGYLALRQGARAVWEHRFNAQKNYRAFAHELQGFLQNDTGSF